MRMEVFPVALKASPLATDPGLTPKHLQLFPEGPSPGGRDRLPHCSSSASHPSSLTLGNGGRRQGSHQVLFLPQQSVVRISSQSWKHRAWAPLFVSGLPVCRLVIWCEPAFQHPPPISEGPTPLEDAPYSQEHCAPVCKSLHSIFSPGTRVELRSVCESGWAKITPMFSLTTK